MSLAKGYAIARRQAPHFFSLARRAYLRPEPATQTDGLAVAAAAASSDSTLPATGATPEADTLRCGQCAAAPRQQPPVRLAL